MSRDSRKGISVWNENLSEGKSPLSRDHYDSLGNKLYKTGITKWNQQNVEKLKMEHNS